MPKDKFNLGTVQKRIPNRTRETNENTENTANIPICEGRHLGGGAGKPIDNQHRLLTTSIIAAGATGGSPEEDPLARDAQAYASAYDTTIEEATRRLNLQDAVGELEQELTSSESDTFAALWVEHEPEFKVVVKFTENGESTIRPYVSGGDLEDLIEVGTAGSTIAALRQAQADAKTTSSSVNTAIESDINVFENRVELYVLDKASFEGKLTEKEAVLPEVVRTIQVPHFSTKEANIYGGLNVSASLGGCTTGFSVTDGAGTYGVTTADHCGDNAQYNGDDLNKEAGSDGASIDLQWLTSPDYTPTNRIKDGHGGRSITGTKHRNNQSVGLSVCKYGRSSGYTCGEIISKYFDPPGNYNATWMRVHNPDEDDLSARGDSGGPWFVGTKAYGTHHGSFPHLNDNGVDTGVDHAIYMAVNYFSHLAVEVLTE